MSNTTASSITTQQPDTVALQRFTPLEDETRPTVDTAAAAHYLHLAPQTMRIYACRESGPLRPRRLPGSSKLHWATADIRRLLSGSQK